MLRYHAQNRSCLCNNDPATWHRQLFFFFPGPKGKKKVVFEIIGAQRWGDRKKTLVGWLRARCLGSHQHSRACLSAKGWALLSSAHSFAAAAAFAFSGIMSHHSLRTAPWNILEIQSFHYLTCSVMPQCMRCIVYVFQLKIQENGNSLDSWKKELVHDFLIIEGFLGRDLWMFYTSNTKL